MVVCHRIGAGGCYVLRNRKRVDAAGTGDVVGTVISAGIRIAHTHIGGVGRAKEGAAAIVVGAIGDV